MLMPTTGRDGGVRAELSCDTCGIAFQPPSGTAGAPALVWAAAHARGWQDEFLGGLHWQRCPGCTALGTGDVGA